MLKIYCSVFCLLVLLTSLRTQSGENEITVRKFATEKYHRIIEAENPEIGEARRDLEGFVRNYHPSGDSMPEEIVIPVVFHIHSDLLLPVLDVANIPIQMLALNDYFNPEQILSNHPADTLEGFGELASNLGVRFCYADILGGPIRIVTGSNDEYGIGNEVKKHPITGDWLAVDPEHNLNIFIANLEEETVAGFAQMPGGPLETDGIVIDPDYFGLFENLEHPFRQGKTLMHLIGNYLGLYSLARDRRCEDDYVDDTPVHNALTNGCEIIYKHVSTCDGYPVKMTMNFMDGASTDCAYMFTEGQRRRVRAMLSPEGPRGALDQGNILCDLEGGILGLAGVEPPEIPDQVFREPVEGLTLFPNPSDGAFSLSWQGTVESDYDFVVHDNIGRVVKRGVGLSLQGTNRVELDLSGEKTGIYQLQIRVAERVYSARVSIQ